MKEKGVIEERLERSSTEIIQLKEQIKIFSQKEFKDEEIQIFLDEKEKNYLKNTMQEMQVEIENLKKEIEKMANEKKELCKKNENLENTLIKTKSNIKNTKSLQNQIIDDLKIKLDKAQRTIEGNENSLTELKKAKKQIIELKNAITKSEENEKKSKFIIAEKELKHKGNIKELNKKISQEHKKFIQINDEFKLFKKEHDKKINKLQEEVHKKDEEINSYQKINDDLKTMNDISKATDLKNIQGSQSIRDSNDNTEFLNLNSLIESNQNRVFKDITEKPNKKYRHDSIKKESNISLLQNVNHSNKATSKTSFRGERRQQSKGVIKDINDQNFVINSGKPPPRKELSPKQIESFSKEVSEGKILMDNLEVLGSRSKKNMDLNLCDASVCSNLQFYEKVLRSELKQLREFYK